MRFIVDLLGAPAKSGGMRLYAEQLVRGWQESFPDDELVLVGDQWLHDSFKPSLSLRILSLPGNRTISRLLEKFFVVPLIYWSSKFEAVLSISPVVSPFVPKSQRFVVVHDWRHLKNPEEFGSVHRLYRRFWTYSCRTAACVINISPKTLAETKYFSPEANSICVNNGQDHPRFWSQPNSIQSHPGPLVVTFGHNTNKRPELLIEAIARRKANHQTPSTLFVLGAEGERRSHLQEIARRLNVDQECVFEGFVSDRRYRDLVQNASVIALMSSDEGFGLPIAEAGYFGIPCIVASDSGVAQLHGNHVIESLPQPESVAAALEKALAGRFEGRGATLPTWNETASGIRMALLKNAATK
ncbi:glycosyltransferase [Arthrobacter sp. KN11-1C]|uniref:glycosyltransferase n=1 Tax=Arthrobacter sp. KN11-1C TaxID=3445774 RepID=UPI003FA08930